MSDQANRLKAATHAVSRACTVCREVQRDLERVKQITKDDRSPVTVADFASQAVVAHVLRERLGSVVLVAEEAADELRKQISEGQAAVADAVVNAVRIVWPEATLDQVLDAIDIGGADPLTQGAHGYWTLDPIDGTKGFLRGGQYAVALAWVENGSPQVGVLGCPNLSKDFNRPLDDPDPQGTMYLALAADGLAELSADDPDGDPLSIRRLPRAEGEPLRMCESVESGHTSHDNSARIMEILGEQSAPVRLDSQAKYAVVGRGQADVYLRMPTRPGYVERIWDHAAGSLVAVESGCFVTDVNGNELDFSHGRGLEKNKGVVVAPAEIHGRLIGAIQELGLNVPAQ